MSEFPVYVKSLIYIVGMSGSGKSTLENNLVKFYPQFYEKEVSATTRRPRAGERDGKDYYFKSKAQFDRMNIIHPITYDKKHYGTPLSELTKTTKSLISVVVPEGIHRSVEFFEKNGINVPIIIVKFDISANTRYKNMINRGDSHEDATSRLNEGNTNEEFDSYNLNNLSKFLTIEIFELNEYVHENTHRAIQMILKNLG